MNRRDAIATLMLGAAACSRGASPRHHGLLDTALLDRKFPTLAARATPAGFSAGLIDAASSRSWFLGGERALPLAGLFVLPMAAAALAEVDAKRLELGERIAIGEMDLSPPYSAIDQAWPTPPEHHGSQMPAIDLIGLAVQTGDNTAADVIMKRIGGPGAVTAWLRQIEISDMRVDRYAREIEQEIAGMVPFRPAWKDEAAWLAARDTVPAGEREGAMNAYIADPRDTATVRAIAELLRRLAAGSLISPASSRLLKGLMSASRTGANRFAAGLSKGATLAQVTSQTRTDLGFTPAANDAAIVTLEDGGRVIMTAMLSGSTATQAERDKLFSDTARLFLQALR
jgi:beta-lactamase class A